MDYVENTTRAGAGNATVLIADNEAWADHATLFAPAVIAEAPVRDGIADVQAAERPTPDLRRTRAPASDSAFAGLAVAAMIFVAIVGLFTVFGLLKKQHEGLDGDPYECGCA
jgi:hypothetical protein